MGVFRRQLVPLFLPGRSCPLAVIFVVGVICVVACCVKLDMCGWVAVHDSHVLTDGCLFQ